MTEVADPSTKEDDVENLAAHGHPGGRATVNQPGTSDRDSIRRSFT